MSGQRLAAVAGRVDNLLQECYGDPGVVGGCSDIRRDIS